MGYYDGEPCAGTEAGGRFTPVGGRPGAAAGPAALPLQPRLAQESVVVGGSARALPAGPGHGACGPCRALLSPNSW